MTLYRNLSREKKRLYKLCYEKGLTEWHWTATQILLDVNGYKNAEEYVKNCKKSEDYFNDKQKKVF